MDKKIRVIIADDSALMRKRLEEILTKDPDIEVIAKAKNGQEVIDLLHTLKPDVITMDVEMPVINGLDAVGYIMSEFPTPCVMISAFTNEGSVETIKALEFGAVDFIEKPDGPISLHIENIEQEIIKKVKNAAEIPKDKLRLIWPEKAKADEVIIKKPNAIKKVFAIASSTGGTQALATIIPSLRADLNACILVVQHMPEGFTKSLAERLNWQSKIPVMEAEDGMLIKPACVILAKGGKHMKVIINRSGQPCVTLSDDPPQLGVKPNANILMSSAADIFKEKTIGIVLTGMGSDGTLGAKAIKLNNGYVIAEDKSSCVVYGMPKSVFEAGLTDKVIPLQSISKEIEELTR